jgi:hypothetical protein
MTKQLNIIKSMHRSMKLKALSISVISIATLIAVMSIITSSSEHSVNAQMMMGDQMGTHPGLENMTSVNGTINIEQTTFEAIDSKVNTSLIQAMTAAEQAVGNDSFALAAFGNNVGGDFVYYIILGTPGMKLYNVLVDPGNGQILATQEVSQKELQKMHLKHSTEVVRSGGGGSGGGFPIVIPH